MKVDILGQDIFIAEPVPGCPSRRAFFDAEGSALREAASRKGGIPELVAARTFAPARDDGIPQRPDAVVTEMGKPRVHHRVYGKMPAILCVLPAKVLILLPRYINPPHSA